MWMEIILTSKADAMCVSPQSKPINNEHCLIIAEPARIVGSSLILIVPAGPFLEDFGNKVNIFILWFSCIFLISSEK